MAAADRSVHPPRSTDLPQQPFALTPLLHRAPKMQGKSKSKQEAMRWGWQKTKYAAWIPGCATLMPAFPFNTSDNSLSLESEAEFTNT